MEDIAEKVVLLFITAVFGGIVTYVTALRKTKVRVDMLEAWKKAVDCDIECGAKERKILLRSMLACLYGLQEQGCNGSVSKGIETLEEFLDDKAHSIKTSKLVD